MRGRVDDNFHCITSWVIRGGIHILHHVVLRAHCVRLRARSRGVCGHRDKLKGYVCIVI